MSLFHSSFLSKLRSFLTSSRKKKKMGKAREKRAGIWLVLRNGRSFGNCPVLLNVKVASLPAFCTVICSLFPPESVFSILLSSSRKREGKNTGILESERYQSSQQCVCLSGLYEQGRTSNCYPSLTEFTSQQEQLKRKMEKEMGRTADEDSPSCHFPRGLRREHAKDHAAWRRKNPNRDHDRHQHSCLKQKQK